MQIKQIAPQYSVSDQLTEADLEVLAAQGFRAVVNFRPDAEGGETQPTSAALASRAASLGLAYTHIPVVPNQLQPADIQQLQQFLQQHPGPTLGFCRTGNRASQAYQHAQISASAAPTPPAGQCAACCQGNAAPSGLFARLRQRLKQWWPI